LADYELLGSYQAVISEADFQVVAFQFIDREALIEEVTGSMTLSLHHDISTVTGEEVVLFTLAGLPAFRETKKK
jgi:uncharacterized protein YbcI